MDESRRSAFSESPYEDKVGFARAVRVGPIVAVAGTCAIKADGTVHAPGDAAAQAAFVFDRIERALRDVGVAMTDVIRTRMFLSGAEHEAGVSAVHAARFGAIRPAATMLVVSGFVLDGLVLEIEADAVVAQ